MRQRRFIKALVLFLVAQGVGGIVLWHEWQCVRKQAENPGGFAYLREYFNPESPRGLVDAYGVWAYDRFYWDENSLHLFSVKEFPFEGIDYRTRDFLEWKTSMRPVVQFSCGIAHGPYEDALEKALTSGPADLRLQALVVLVAAKAPRSVDRQWEALRELKREGGGPLWQELIRELDIQFTETRILEMIGEDWNDGPPDYYWAIRAAGVTQLKQALPRLKVLSHSNDLYSSLAAERSIEDFPGVEGDEALAHCIKGWRYDASLRAGQALFLRNKPLLIQTLLEDEAPMKYEWIRSELLVKCDRHEAVPILAKLLNSEETIPRHVFSYLIELSAPEDEPLLVDVYERASKKERMQFAKVLELCRSKWNVKHPVGELVDE